MKVGLVELREGDHGLVEKIVRLKLVTNRHFYDLLIICLRLLRFHFPSSLLLPLPLHLSHISPSLLGLDRSLSCFIAFMFFDKVIFLEKTSDLLALVLGGVGSGDGGGFTLLFIAFVELMDFADDAFNSMNLLRLKLLLTKISEV